MVHVLGAEVELVEGLVVDVEGSSIPSRARWEITSKRQRTDNEKNELGHTHARTRVEFNPVSFLRFAELPAETTYVGDDDETETVETNTIARDLSGHTLDSLLSLTNQTLSFIYHYSRPSAKEQ